jgi:(2Fe-2S) ferredoxin
MTGATIAALVIELGPLAFNFIDSIIEVWNKDLTPDEVKAIVASHRKTEAEYVAAEMEKRKNA